MAHLSQENDALVKRVRRIIGQLQAVERSIGSDADCGTTLHQVAAVRGAVGGLLMELMEAHLHRHVAADGLDADARDKAAQELIAAMRRYAK